jgi:hypothetical protein
MCVQLNGQAQAQRFHKGSGARREAPVQEGQAADGGAASRDAQLDRAYVRPQVRGFGDVQGGAGGGVPELGACAGEEQGRETALARVPAQGHTRVGAPRVVPEELGGARRQDGRVHGGARGRARGRDLDRRRRGGAIIKTTTTRTRRAGDRSCGGAGTLPLLLLLLRRCRRCCREKTQG